jgi:hypothetical protein
MADRPPIYKTAVDDLDYSDRYNTKLSDDEETGYRDWAKKNKREGDVYDYDMRGAWKEGIGADDSGHFPDTYKKPNHPSFSDESKYHGTDGQEGGKWSKKDGKDVFTPGKTNKALRSRKEMEDYFSREDSGGVLADE